MLSGLGNGNGDVAEEAGVESVTDIANGTGFQLPSFFTDQMVNGVPNWVLMGGAIVALVMFSGRR